MSEVVPMGARAFVEFASSWRDAIDAAVVAGYVGEPTEGLGDYLYRPALTYSARGGKRLRPALVVLAAECFGLSGFDALCAAAAVEHFQTAALIHDDIADHADTRRGAPSLHRIVGEGLAINIGDCSLVESFADLVFAEGLDEAVRHRLIRELTTMMIRTVEGQALDLGWAHDGRWDVTPDDYLRMATLKSAHYSVATPLVMGAVLAHAPRQVLEPLRSFGLDVGLAFQIADDLLDLEGTQEQIGKRPLGDLAEGKRTLPVTWALAHLDEDGRARLVVLLSKQAKADGDLEEAKSLVEKGGGIEHARALARELVDKAEATLKTIPMGQSRAAGALRGLPAYVIQRQS